MRLPIGVLIAGTLAAGFLIPEWTRRWPIPLHAAQPASSAATAGGPTATRLPDGRWLLVGGTGSEARAVLWDPVNGTATPTGGSLHVPRAEHSATLLSDGTVLIVGGRQGGALIESPELFDPATGTFTLLPIVGAVPRASHTATLLTDGQVLVAGGSNGGPTPLEVELWDVPGQTATALPGAAVNRSGHQATLQSDGRVLVTGGDAVAGPPARGAILVDPVAPTVRAINPPAEPRRPPVVVDTLPRTGATNVPLDAHLALRFSDALIPASVTPASVRLSGPDGIVKTRIVVAEDGRLAFVWPAEPFTEDTTYAVTIDGPIDPFGVTVIPTSMAFTTTTRATRPDSGANDTEAWVPSADASDGWRSGRPPSSWTALPPLAGPLGVTAIAGQVLTLDGRPLRNVTFSLEGDSASTRSDGTGRFLLVPRAAPSGHGVLHIDGATAGNPNRTYGFFEWGFEWNYELKAGQTSALRFPIWMPKLDTDHTVQIPSPTTSETVITTPTMPGFELHLPAGTVIRDHDGKVVRAVSLTPIPLDRPPFPLPGDATFTMDYTIQPGGAYVSTPGGSGAWVVYPARASSGPAGKRVQFFAYDPDDAGWTVYGMGTVGATQVKPDARTRIYAFTKASFNDGNTPAPGHGPDNEDGGDPVDTSTGAFIMHKTDLFLPDVIPIAVTRTYNSLDTYARPFGTGMMHAYTIFQHSEHQFDEADLIQTDGAKIHYVRISADGLPWYSTVLESQAAPNGFYKSRISFNFTDNGWTLARTDGTVYIFGHEAPLQKIRDRYGNEVRVSWSGTNTFGAGVGNITRVTSPNGRYIDFTYYAGTSRVYQAKDNTGRTVTYTYDTNGNLLTVTDPLSQVTTYTYDASNRMLTVRDGRNIVYLTNAYTSGRVTTQTLAEAGQTYQFAYTVDGSNNITQTDLTDPRGTVKRLSFNSNHFMTTAVEALGTAVARTTTHERQSGSNLLTAVTDGLSRRTEFTYDSNGHVLTTTRLAGTANALTTTSTYEPLFGQVASVTDPLSHTWTVSYDAIGRPTGVTDPLSHQMTVQVNGSGQVTSVTDPMSHTWQWGYTGGDLTSTADPFGNTTRRFVDAAGRPLSTTDPMGRVTLMTFDALNRATTVTDALGGQTGFSYDANNNLLSLTDPLTHATSYTYDNRDRVATRTDPLTRQASYAYDATSNLTQTTDRKSQVTSRTYDSLNRPTLVTFADTSTIAYAYDAGDRVVQITDSANGTITRTYDDLDRLTSETTPEGTVSYTYDADGRRATMTVAGQTAVSYGYDNAHRLTSITQGTAVVAFTYDEANRRSTLTYPNGIVATYGYDITNQLTSLTYASGQTTLGDLTYTYDAAGRRTAVGGNWARTGIPAAVASATYDEANRITAWGGTTLTYDLNGNLTSDGTTTYTWNARNQLAALSGGATATFEYDGRGRRRRKTIGGTSASFLYDGLNLVQELSGSTPIANLLTGLGIDETFTRTDTNGTSTLLTDGLGSTLALADASAAVQTSYSYEPFGKTSVSRASSTSAVQFTGRENDNGTGLYYLRARYYLANLGQFTTEDPLGFSDLSSNLRSYVSNQPTNLIDPLGLAQQYPEPTFPDGRLRPPPMPVPGPPGNEWVPLDRDPSGRRPWKPKEPCPSPKGSQPRPQWDPEGNHWDYDDGTGGERQHFLPDGTPVDHWNNPIAPRTWLRPPTPQELLQIGIALGGTLIIIGRSAIWIFF